MLSAHAHHRGRGSHEQGEHGVKQSENDLLAMFRIAGSAFLVRIKADILLTSTKDRVVLLPLGIEPEIAV